jgi:general secretion pathway protein G
MRKHFPRRRSRVRHAFTLMEVLLVLAILVVLASGAVVAVAKIRQNSNVSLVQNQIGLFKTALGVYVIDCQRYPDNLQDLRVNNNNSPRWKGPYLDQDIPADVWDRPYNYQVSADGQSYELFSSGADGVSGTADDIGITQ